MEQQIGGVAVRGGSEGAAPNGSGARSSGASASTAKPSVASRPSRPILTNPNAGRRIQFVRVEARAVAPSANAARVGAGKKAAREARAAGQEPPKRSRAKGAAKRARVKNTLEFDVGEAARLGDEYCPHLLKAGVAPKPPIFHEGGQLSSQEEVRDWLKQHVEEIHEHFTQRQRNGTWKRFPKTCTLLSVVASYSGPPDQDDPKYKLWLQLVAAWATKRFGKYVLAICEHVDEPYGHVHILVSGSRPRTAAEMAQHGRSGDVPLPVNHLWLEDAHSPKPDVLRPKPPREKAIATGNTTAFGDEFHVHVGEPCGLERQGDVQYERHSGTEGRLRRQLREEARPIILRQIEKTRAANAKIKAAVHAKQDADRREAEAAGKIEEADEAKSAAEKAERDALAAREALRQEREDLHRGILSETMGENLLSIADGLASPIQPALKRAYAKWLDVGAREQEVERQERGLAEQVDLAEARGWNAAMARAEHLLQEIARVIQQKVLSWRDEGTVPPQVAEQLQQDLAEAMRHQQRLARPARA